MEQTEKYVVFKNKQTGEYMERDNSDDILAVKFAAFKEKTNATIFTYRDVRL